MMMAYAVCYFIVTTFDWCYGGKSRIINFREVQAVVLAGSSEDLIRESLLLQSSGLDHPCVDADMSVVD